MSAVTGLLARRRAGVLLHPTSLPSPYGPGDLGHAAYRFVEFLAEAGFGVWQVLPLGPTHANRSPYDALSAFAGNPALLSLDWMRDRGFLEEVELARVVAQPGWRTQALAVAALRFATSLRSDAALASDVAAFRARNAHWLEDYVQFVALREAQGGLPWYRWPVPLREREPAALANAIAAASTRIAALRFEQYVFARQWQELRAYAAAREVYLFGDVPIFVAHDSADVWVHRGLFRLDAEGLPVVEAGVPPDYFSAEGQRWGNPHYDWTAMAQDGFAWWRARIAAQRGLCDLLRLDHFRGFEACWEIPREARHAAQGRWAPAPGAALLGALQEVAGPGALVAENLGIITPEVERLRRGHGLPGMRVLQFAFDGDPANPYLPHNHEPLEVVYTGTHDNDTTLGWFQGLDPEACARVLDYLGKPAEPMPWPLLRAALASVARLAILPLQDVLGLGAVHRMNQPGVSEGNWGWQLGERQLDATLAVRLRAMLRAYGRLPG